MSMRQTHEEMEDDTMTDNTTTTEGKGRRMNVRLTPEAALKLAAIAHAASADMAREALTYTRLTVTSETVTSEATDSYMLVRRTVPCSTTEYADVVTAHVSAKQFADAVKGSKRAVSLTFGEDTVEIADDDRITILPLRESSLDYRRLWNMATPVGSNKETRRT